MEKTVEIMSDTDVNLRRSVPIANDSQVQSILPQLTVDEINRLKVVAQASRDTDIKIILASLAA
jgi:hypothetical protein